MAGRYKNRAKADQLNKDGGYKNVVLFHPVDDFNVLAKPTPSGTPASGESLEITDDHTFTGTGNGFYSYLCEQETVTIKGKTVDKQMEWEAEFTLLGDSSSTQEQMQDHLDDQNVWLLKDSDCKTTDTYVQLGDECKQPKVEVTFDGANQASGLKKYTVKLTAKNCKYWYKGTVTLHS